MNKPKNNETKDFLTFLTTQPKGYLYEEKKITKNLFRDEKQQQLERLFAPYKACMKCPLGSQGRTNVVFGSGNPDANIMFIGEGPGRNEDLEGLPFVGRSGKLLTKIINAMNLKRDDVYISNAVKCRPPENRAPTAEESSLCKSLMLYQQIKIIRPKIICTLGASAAQAILGPDVRISSIRGTFQSFDKINVMPTFHPAYLLRNPKAKTLVWDDMKKIMLFLKNHE